MNIAKVGDWAQRYIWLIALVVVICFGCMVGKDLAMRDNVRDAAAVNKRAS